ncbi:MAG: hypothetical protein ACAI44_14660 [Candidatus Sericytochromatia bacterium]
MTVPPTSATPPAASPAPQPPGPQPNTQPDKPPAAVPAVPDQIRPLPALGLAGAFSFVETADKATPGSFSLDTELVKTKIALETSKAETPGKPARIKAESTLDERLASFKNGRHHGELKVDGLFKASAEGIATDESTVFTSAPKPLEGQLGLRQSFGGELGKLKYQSELFGQQNLSPLLQGQELPDYDLGASTRISYSTGPATLGLDARSDALGSDSLTSKLDYKRGDAALSLILGQENPANGQAFEKYAAQLKLGGKGPLSGFLGGELRSVGSESLKAGLSYAHGRTHFSSEAASTGSENRFAVPALTHSLAYQLGSGWDLKLAARPQAKDTEQRLSLGLQGNF